MSNIPPPAASRFRFRAWHKKKKFMFRTDALREHGVELHHFGEHGYDKRMTKDFYPFTAVEVMQSTGLTDKTGHEIFEGDILKGYGTYPMEIIAGKYGWMLRYTDGRDGAVVVDPVDEHFFREYEPEVIGNIYEHPHLLK